jgi:hypothetical protein
MSYANEPREAASARSPGRFKADEQRDETEDRDRRGLDGQSPNHHPR